MPHDGEQKPANPMEAARRLTAPPRQKRFYAKVETPEEDGGFTLRLDGKRAMTPGRRPLAAPHRPLADAIAVEWAAQGEFIDPASMPVTRFVNTAIDGVAGRMAEVRADILAYAGTDLLYYRAEEPEGLVANQNAAWDPILDWAEKRFSVRFIRTAGISHAAQPEPALAAIATELDREHDPFRLAGLHLATSLSGSALIALAISASATDVEAAWAAAHVDEDWNISRWGDDPEAMRRRARRLEDFRAAALALA